LALRKRVVEDTAYTSGKLRVGVSRSPLWHHIRRQKRSPTWQPIWLRLTLAARQNLGFEDALLLRWQRAAFQDRSSPDRRFHLTWGGLLRVDESQVATLRSPSGPAVRHSFRAGAAEKLAPAAGCSMAARTLQGTKW